MIRRSVMAAAVLSAVFLPFIGAAPVSAAKAKVKFSQARLNPKTVKGGAAVRLVGPQIGLLASADGEQVDADASLENEPAFLFDALVLPAGDAAVKALAGDARAIEGICNVSRHCKPMLVLGSGTDLLDKAGIPQRLPSDEHDPGLLLGSTVDSALTRAFLILLALHRHFDRETDPPRV